MATNEELKALLARWIGTYGIYRAGPGALGFQGAWCCDLCGAFSYEGPETIEHMDDCLIAATQKVLTDQESIRTAETTGGAGAA